MIRILYTTPASESFLIEFGCRGAKLRRDRGLSKPWNLKSAGRSAREVRRCLARLAQGWLPISYPKGCGGLLSSTRSALCFFRSIALTSKGLPIVFANFLGDLVP